MWWKAVSYNKLQQTHYVYGVHKWTLYISFGNKSNVWYRNIYSNIGTGTAVVYAWPIWSAMKKTSILYNKYTEHGLIM
jgi:hypothetical protein